MVSLNEAMNDELEFSPNICAATSLRNECNVHQEAL